MSLSTSKNYFHKLMITEFQLYFLKYFFKKSDHTLAIHPEHTKSNLNGSKEFVHNSEPSTIALFFRIF